MFDVTKRIKEEMISLDQKIESHRREVTLLEKRRRDHKSHIHKIEDQKKRIVVDIAQKIFDAAPQEEKFTIKERNVIFLPCDHPLKDFSKFAHSPYAETTTGYLMYLILNRGVWLVGSKHTDTTKQLKTDDGAYETYVRRTFVRNGLAADNLRVKGGTQLEKCREHFKKYINKQVAIKKNQVLKGPAINTHCSEIQEQIQMER